ncbi:NADPH-dependent oxidoreductase [Halorhabdus sp. CBA1104]|uniref:NADPH-dependent FMN reductase n=1 Tax=unclassified Halorhabdus TaxID=2621901 RepID=UPI0012B2DB5E|nr:MULTISPECIES: NAD(P)H-dependent oxidoreductase [unclassified Halorhabdus]QGN06685.1 NADPH-dependent oxidoreductase [Halorhabdus sp. CBA1104]
MTETDVVGICGSLRDDSHTRKALRLALQAAADAGASTELLDLREWTLPVFDADDGDAGDAPAFRERVRTADTVLLGTPVYHGSFATPLKNALDYCGFDEFEHTTIGLLAVAGGRFPISALEQLRTVSRALDAWVIPHQVAIPRASSVFDGERLLDDELRELLDVLGREAVQYAHIDPDPESFQSGENVGADD